MSLSANLTMERPSIINTIDVYSPHLSSLALAFPQCTLGLRCVQWNSRVTTCTDNALDNPC